MEKCKENLKIFIAIFGLIGTGLIIYLTITYNQNSKEIAQNLSSQINELNSNVIQLLPKEPIIIINGFAQNDFPGREIVLYEKIGYLKCVRNSLIPIQDNQNYERLLLWFENKGKKTSDLRAKIDCSPNSFILAFCVSSENAEIQTDNLINIDAVVKIKELNSITPERVEIFYQLDEQNKSSCSISYDSSDFSQGESQIININYLPYH